ncbi:alkyl hydroperoxide reductase/ Thiol specific antioxidant/ Mal allergen [Neobacillus bataviensis LMG 21833]|uniref:Alkyl hydroperoxide reductase/ Thiol specific antioxidant/ Mal allergen n=1 Tax=Neobacillus bataviensis LMG 21833 TaxID=1117379 RepID=K6DQN0_9BACI|nr:redoxin domain-containing protein [Neobacillus bataviensis]EKN70649.1 alkyl hydroperoxide reductase/ Thiol specific antioxidant/ Mal allergen [Neobacillus bataviensis LMG 21833]
MKKVQLGMKAPEFTFNTPWLESNQLYDVLENKKTILMFLRYYGCSLCQLDIATLISGYEKIKGNNAQVLVVLQTEPALISEQVNHEKMPLTIVCDPERVFFNLYGVEPGKSESDLLSEEVLEKLKTAKERGISKIDNGGKQNELQLPATFIINPDGNIVYAHYGTHAADIPNVNDLIILTSGQ